MNWDKDYYIFLIINNNITEEKTQRHQILLSVDFSPYLSGQWPAATSRALLALGRARKEECSLLWTLRFSCFCCLTLYFQSTPFRKLEFLSKYLGGIILADDRDIKIWADLSSLGMAISTSLLKGMYLHGKWTWTPLLLLSNYADFGHTFNLSQFFSN